MFAKLARFVHGNGRRVVIGALVAAIVFGAFGIGVASHMSPYGANDPASQSVKATNRFQAAAGRQIDAGVVALVSSGKVNTAAARQRVARVVTELQGSPDVARVVSYYDSHDPAMVSRDGRSTYVLAYFRPRSDAQLKTDATAIQSRFRGQSDVQLGGDQIANAEVNTQVGKDLASSELLAFPFIFLLSLLFFRSVTSAVLPPLLGGLAIVTTFFVLRIVTGFVDLSVFSLNFVTGLGLGLAIDYSLFMVSRYREEAAKSGFGLEAIRTTLQTAGRTILFSALTVAAAVSSLAVFPQRFLYSMGIAGAIVVLVAATLALTVLPAILTVLGPRVNSLSPRWLARRAEREARPAQAGFWYRLAQFVMRRPGQIAIAATAFLIFVGLPFWSIRFISVSASDIPTTMSARQVSDTLNSDFPANRTTPLEIVLGAPAGSSQATAFATRLERLPGIAAVAPAQPAGPDMSLVAVTSRSGPLSSASQRLVHRVRALHAPFYVGVAGVTAAFVDLESSLKAHLPLVLTIVIGSTLVILFLMTGSIVLPIKAVLMNALGLSAMFGILVWLFQDGHGQSLLSFKSLGALDATQPIFLFAVGFGLATDYGVFLLSRIKEAHDAGAENSEAVATGLERTGRIVTAAAALFAVAIGAFALSGIVFIKELGIGAALTVLIDATIIRALLVPSLMRLLGDWNWYAPKPLARLYTRIGLREGAQPGTVTPSLQT
jgi:RND superfamily putative drug exporter